MTTIADLVSKFADRFEVAPRLFRAPGRVNIIGEHTDYNEGFVLPAAIGLSTFAGVAPRRDRRIRVHSLAFAETFEFDLDDPAPAPRRAWSDYVRGVAIALERAGHRLKGADLMLHGDLPMGAGLSASAALEVSVGYSLCRVSDVTIDLTDLALICQRAENEFVGMRCGVMDQFISCRGVAGCALLLDCRSLEARPVRVDPGIRLVVANTMVHHALADSEYNLRRQECESAVERLAAAIEGIASLRDVTPEQLALYGVKLPERIFRRARHVVSENARVLQAAAALEIGDVAKCGQLMNESHVSLRDDYEVSCAELDLMVELACGVDGAFGARMTGGGFGGCAISLVKADCVERFREIVGEAYRSATGLTPSIFSCAPGSGVEAAAS
jgi:galactokinase